MCPPHSQGVPVVVSSVFVVFLIKCKHVSKIDFKIPLQKCVYSYKLGSETKLVIKVKQKWYSTTSCLWPSTMWKHKRTPSRSGKEKKTIYRNKRKYYQESRQKFTLSGGPALIPPNIHWPQAPKESQVHGPKSNSAREMVYFFLNPSLSLHASHLILLLSIGDVLPFPGLWKLRLFPKALHRVDLT